MSATDQLAQESLKAAEDASLDDLSRAGHAVLDHLTCAIVGARLTHSQPHFRVMETMGPGREEVTCWDGSRKPVLVAAYLNAQAANALDFDDTLLGHPGAPIIATALAVAEAEDRSIGDLLRGVLAGYQAHWLVARAAHPSSGRARRVRGVGVWDAVAASVAAAVTAGRTPGQLIAAVEIAATHSTLPYVAKWYERPVPTLKNNLGWSAAAAVLSHGLAEAGARGIPRPLDGPAGMWLMAGSDRWRWNDTLADAEPAIQKVGFKRYPACWHLQSYLKTTDDALRASDDTAELSATITGPSDVAKFVPAAIAGPAEVAFSLPTCIALILEGIPPGPAWVEPSNMARAGRRAERIRFERGPRRSVRLEASTSSRTRRVPKGDFMRPRPLGLSDSEVRSKFHAHVTPVVGEGASQAERLVLGDAGATPVKRLVEVLR